MNYEAGFHLELERFQISSYQADKAELFFRLIQQNRSRLEDFFAGTVAQCESWESANLFFADMQNRINERSFFPFFLFAPDSKMIGLVDVKNIDWRVPKAELGYFIDKDFEGQGVITKSVGAVIDFLVPAYGFRKLFCRISNKNLGSIQVALKNHFELEGTLRCDYKTTKGELVDLNYYGRLF